MPKQNPSANAKHKLAVGTRVKHRQPTEAITHGIVVWYRGKHDPREPRVRWHSGWGTSCKPDDIIPLTQEEMETLPLVKTCTCDKIEIITGRDNPLGEFFSSPSSTSK
jgi:hypothetical protein